MFREMISYETSYDWYKNEKKKIKKNYDCQEIYKESSKYDKEKWLLDNDNFF